MMDIKLIFVSYVRKFLENFYRVKKYIYNDENSLFFYNLEMAGNVSNLVRIFLTSSINSKSS